jgi:hypothetical protein
VQFFDQYDRFYATSQTSPYPHRLNGRYEAIIARNAHLLSGKRILPAMTGAGPLRRCTRERRMLPA